MRVCIGGTFNIFHNGHKLLIDKAFQIAGEKGFVFIGVTEGKILKNKKFVIPFDERVNEIKKYLNEKKYEKHSEIKPIFDIDGQAVKGNFDVIIVSPETIKNAEKINEKRKNDGKKPLIIVTIPFVLAEDKKPISSTRIYEKIIDKNGNVL
jgi:pantetheine-phosphate adenylyltransferase